MPVVTISRERAAGTAFCPGCGQECPAGSSFCHRCGAVLIARESEHPRPPWLRPARSKVWLLALVALLTGCALAAAGAVLLADGDDESAVDLAGALAEPAAEEVPPLLGDGAEEDANGAITATAAAAGADPYAGWRSCENEVYGFRLRYPSEWYTAAATDEQACRFFDLRPFEADADGPTSVTAVNVFVFPDQPFDAFLSREAGDAAVRLERTDLALGGRRAQLIEATIDTESGRTRAYEYALEFGDGLLVLEVLEGGAAGFEVATQAADGMASTLEGP